MTTDTNTTLIRRWWDALNQGNAAAVIDTIYAANYILHDPSLPEPAQGLEGVRAFVTSVTSGFPDARYTIEDLVATGDKVVQRLSVQATHQASSWAFLRQAGRSRSGSL